MHKSETVGRAFGSHPKGRGFDSLRVHKTPYRIKRYGVSFCLGQLFFQYSCPSGCDTSKLLSNDLKNKLYYDCFQKFCITTRTRQGRSKPFLEREGFGFFVFGGVPRRTTKASAAHGRAASAQAQCTADAYFLCRAPSPDGEVRASAAF